LDDMLRQLLSTRIAGLPANQISFSAPDDDWRKTVSGSLGMVLDVYLIELYENAELRSNDVYMQGSGINQQAVRAPARLNCRYLISAWSPAKPTPLVEPAIEEGVLLHEVTTVLMEALPLDANAIYGPNPLPPGFPPEMLNPALPAVVAPSQPFDKMADFWMRMDTIWKPVVDLVVTLPVVHAPRLSGPPVTTLFSEFGTVGHPDLEELTAIGGVVTLTGQPVTGAWVRLVELNRTVTTNPAGQFIFEGLRRGAYHLEAGLQGHLTVTRAIDVPSLSGEYNLVLI
ncbi:MAG TPA: Pvc16 family protein, partial [Candidatus Dormibacteraeota bacterium]|nr:Pvc16 family protein [Candidatus Dormibacteraeota bacterium]